MSERVRVHEISSKDPSGLLPELGSRKRRHFIDPVLLESTTTNADALAALAIGAGVGIAAVGIGLGTFFYQRGRAEEIRALRDEESKSEARQQQRRDIPPAQ